MWFFAAVTLGITAYIVCLKLPLTRGNGILNLAGKQAGKEKPQSDT